MSNKELIQEAEAFLEFHISKEAFVCKYCDPDVGFVCEYCQALDMIVKLKNGLKNAEDG